MNVATVQGKDHRNLVFPIVTLRGQTSQDTLSLIGVFFNAWILLRVRTA